MAIGRIPEPLAGIQEAILDAKGDLISATAADTPARLAVGSNNQILMADSAQSTGLKWAASATSTLTAKGDLLTATAANTIARLGVGADGTTLVADSSQSTGLKWATPSSGAMVFITGASFSTVSSVSFPTNTFTSTYDIYKVFFQFNNASSATAVQLRMRNAGTDVTSGGYFFGGMGTDYNSATTTYLSNSAVTAWNIRANNNIDRTLWELTVCNPQNSSYGGNCWITGMGDLMGTYSSGLWQNAVSTFDSMSIIKSTSGTFSGKYAVYGIVKS